jgi:hypothetical protein
MLINGIPKDFLEDGRHSVEDFENAIKAVEEVREPQWADQIVGGIGPDVIYLRDEKYKYRYYPKTGRLYGLTHKEFDNSYKSDEDGNWTHKEVCTYKRLN